MCNIYRCVLLFFFTSLLHAQKSIPSKDSLSHLSAAQLEDRYNNTYTTSNALLYANIIIKKGRNDQNLELIANGYLKKAKTLGKVDDKNTIPTIDKAISLTKDSIKNASLTYRYIYEKGVILYNWGAYKNALDCYLEAHDYYDEMNNKGMLLELSHDIALLKIATGDYAESLHTLQKNMIVYNDSNHALFNKYNHINSLMAIADANLKKYLESNPKDIALLDSAMAYNKIGIEKSIAYEDYVGLNYFELIHVIILYEKKQFDKAIEELKRLKEKTKKLGLTHNYSTIHFYLGKIYFDLDKLGKAEFHLRKTDSLSQKKSFNYSILQETYSLLTKIAERKDDYKTYKKYSKLSQENDRKNHKMDLAIRDKYNKKFKIEPLESLNKKLLVSNKTQKIILGIAVLLIGFLIIILFKFKKRQKENKVAFEALVRQIEHAKTEKPKVTQKLKIKDEKVTRILKELEKFEQREQFLGVHCNLDYVAKKIKTNKAYLSKVIRDHKQQKFIEYITKLRIDYVLNRLKDDPLFRAYDIKSIALELGYKSSDSFSRAFKSRTGIYPSYYIKNLNKLEI